MSPPSISQHSVCSAITALQSSVTVETSRVFLSERIVKSRLTCHLSSNNLLNPHQSAYCKHHSTETALLYIHDHLINAIGSQHVLCLCLLDLSAAFDTIDHNILLCHLSYWFGIHGTVLYWFKSYVSSRSFHVRCSGSLSSSQDSLYGIPQGSVLGPLVFILYHKTDIKQKQN